ncbi:hypothetical protein EXS73_00015 [Candidatus Pacearchaeota archaeon]|nr:hypothetical protein [Candidatus Pacearchaeota archaeon]
MNWGGLFGIVVLVSVLVYGWIALYPSPVEVAQVIAGTSSTPSFIATSLPADSRSSLVIVSVEASQFTYTPKVVRVKSGQNVTIQITNVDTVHGLRIPALAISGTKSVNFIAPAPGTYEFSCPTMCGSGHREMQGTLVVE